MIAGRKISSITAPEMFCNQAGGPYVTQTFPRVPCFKNFQSLTLVFLLGSGSQDFHKLGVMTRMQGQLGVAHDGRENVVGTVAGLPGSIVIAIGWSRSTIESPNAWLRTQARGKR